MTRRAQKRTNQPQGKSVKSLKSPSPAKEQIFLTAFVSVKVVGEEGATSRSR